MKLTKEEARWLDDKWNDFYYYFQVEDMFEKSIVDAKNAFKISLAMNAVVFLVGITLLTMSGVLAVLNDNENRWAGVGVSSGTGFLSVVYSCLLYTSPSPRD